MKQQSMTRRQQRNFNNARVYNSIRNKYTPKFNFITVATLLMNFGHGVMTFLGSLVREGCTPFEGLNRGQMRQMWWLQAMYR